mgnify:CR=1 FL=1
MNLKKEKCLVKSIRPMLINCWNFNNEEQCKSALISFAYIPKEFDYLDTPKIRFTLVMKNGRTQDNFNCDNNFVGLINDICSVLYRYIYKEV